MNIFFNRISDEEVVIYLVEYDVLPHWPLILNLLELFVATYDTLALLDVAEATGLRDAPE